MGVRVDHLTILVSDWAAYRAHYGTLLPIAGFTQVNDRIWTDGDGFFLQFGEAKPGTTPYERYGAGLNHWGMAMPSVEAVDRLRDRLIEAGLDIQPVQELGGSHALFIPDPDGLRAEFTYTPPGMDPVD
ncbi:glyoxalase [Sphingomonas sabuli]|uniref:Glyoxalase n=1 Tax=Sphingomonas sabuli TaxID=2764186 RepID=A0A7G9L4R4_9SPHN|nr:VOC family protein [Sphingomonas sabuli]QNM83613.1 glyoxalase [Sphingomonas sabuli]